VLSTICSNVMVLKCLLKLSGSYAPAVLESALEHLARSSLHMRTVVMAYEYGSGYLEQYVPFFLNVCHSTVVVQYSIQ
jgi:hypothetical protein